MMFAISLTSGISRDGYIANITFAYRRLIFKYTFFDRRFSTSDLLAHQGLFQAHKIKGKERGKMSAVPDLPELLDKLSEPQVPEVRDKTSTKQKNEPVQPVKKERKERDKESNKYVVLDLTEDELKYPEKVHRGQTGRSATSQMLAGNTVLGLNELDKQMRKTLDKNSLQQLQDKRRKLLMFLRHNTDVAQYVDIKKN